MLTEGRLRATIRLKLVAALVAGLLGIALGTAVLMEFVHERAVHLAASHEVAIAAGALADVEALEVGHMSALLDVLVTSERLADRFEARDRAGLLELARPMFERLRGQHGITHWYFHPPDPAVSGVFLRVHRPELAGDAVRRPVMARAVATRAEASGRDLGRTSFAVRVVRPWFRGERLIGFVELGQDVPLFLARMKRMTGDEYGMLLAKSGLDRLAWGALVREADRWDSRPDLVAVETTTGDESLLGDLGRLADVPDEPTLLGEVQRDGRALARGIFPLRDDQGRKVGGVVVLHDVSALHAGVADVRARVVVLVLLLAVALAALVVFLLETLVFERLQRMTRLLEDLPSRLARGEYSVEDLAPRRDDEVGRFEAFLQRAVRDIGSFVVDVRREGPRTRRIVREEPPT